MTMDIIPAFVADALREVRAEANGRLETAPAHFYRLIKRGKIYDGIPQLTLEMQQERYIQ